MQLKKYLDDINSVDGWCIPELWNCIKPIDMFQRKNDIHGPIGEIGVYHGKFFIGLALTKADEKGHTAIDVFDMQRFNLDNAGQGSLQQLTDNAEKYGVTDFETITADSLRLRENIINEHKDKFSLFSVDGCHMVEHTINDFKIAMQMVKKEGVIFIDDYYNPNWPGVQEGVVKYYLTNTPDFVPFLFTCNKLFLCSLSLHSQYLNFVSKYLHKFYTTSKIKKVKRFGYDSLTVIPDRKLRKYLVTAEEASQQQPA